MGYFHQQQHCKKLCRRCLGADYRERLKRVKIASIGPITTATLRELGLEPTLQAETYNIDGLVAAIQKK